MLMPAFVEPLIKAGIVISQASEDSVGLVKLVRLALNDMRQNNCFGQESLLQPLQRLINGQNACALSDAVTALAQSYVVGNKKIDGLGIKCREQAHV